MLEAKFLQDVLRNTLPDEMQSDVLTLVNLLAELVNKGFLPNWTQDATKSSFSTEQLLKSLAGKEVAVKESIISFGDSTQIGDVQVQDIAGNNIFKINLYFNYSGDAYAARITSSNGNTEYASDDGGKVDFAKIIDTEKMRLHLYRNVLHHHLKELNPEGVLEESSLTLADRLWKDICSIKTFLRDNKVNIDDDPIESEKPSVVVRNKVSLKVHQEERVRLEHIKKLLISSKKTKKENFSRFILCDQCNSISSIALWTKSCPYCDFAVPSSNFIPTSNAVGLVGIYCSGKTLYLSTLYDQLMNASKEWRVETSGPACQSLLSHCQALREGYLPPATSLGQPLYLGMQIYLNRQKMDLLMWDVAGENYGRYYDLTMKKLLLQCRVIMVTVLCQRLNGTDTLGHEYRYDDEFLALFVRDLMCHNNSLRHVMILLIGVDIFGSSPEEAVEPATVEFNRKYRSFIGMLNNYNLSRSIVPISNIGFGNKIDPQKPILSQPPTPFNVLEPIRQIAPLYLPWWRKG
jgi:hypothetical protein